MRSSSAILLLLLGLPGMLVGQTRKERAIEREMHRLEGDWQIESLVINGVEKNKAIDTKKLSQCRIENGCIHLVHHDILYWSQPFQIDPARKPRHFDFIPESESNQAPPATIPTEGEDTQRIYPQLGIYALDKDVLKIIVCPNANDYSTTSSAEASSSSSAPASRYSREQLARPTSFDAKKGSHRMLVILKRVPGEGDRK